MILVTGSEGFIGRALLSKLNVYQSDVLGIDFCDGDISDPETLLGERFDNISHIFHLAGKIFVPHSWQDPYSFYKINVIGTQNILDLCRRTGANLTFVSAYIYGISKRQPISETEAVNPNNPYAHSKYLAEQLCLFYSKEYGISSCIVRPFNIFGAGQDKRFLIPSIIDQVTHLDSVTLQNLTCKRDYLYIDDFVEALICTIKARNDFAIYNIGSGYSLSVDEIVKTIQEIWGTNKPVILNKDAYPNQIENTVADIAKAKKELSWQPKISFVEGIGQMVHS